VNCLAEQALPAPERYLQVADNDYAATMAAAQALLAQPRRPTAIVCSTDVSAVGALKAASTAAIRVPQELSIVGFDDIPLAEFTIPSLTTVHQPLRQLSQMAIKQLLEAADSLKQPPQVTMIVPSLVVRNSTATPPS
jgi:LacI family transcriptional regulator